MQILKYVLEVTDEQVISLPAIRKFMHLDNQRGQITLWYLVDSTSDMDEVTFNIVGTGQEMPDEIMASDDVAPYIRYRGTVLIDDARSVWHVFESEL